MAGLIFVIFSRKLFLVSLVSLIFITPQLMSRQTISEQFEYLDKYVFCFIGDSGKVNAVQGKVAKALSNSDCTHIWHTGDIVYPSGINSANDPNFSNKFLIPFKELFKKEIPFFLTLGNHDHKKNPKAFLEIASSEPLINFPNYFYQKDFGSICFVALDTTVFDKIYMFNRRDIQIKWLKKTKESLKNSCKFSIAVGHHPLFSSGDRKRATPQLSMFLKNHIFGSFDVYVSGHNHVLADEGALKNTIQLISGTGSLPGGSPKVEPKGIFNQERPGFLKLIFYFKENSIYGNYKFIAAETGRTVWENNRVGKGIRLN